MRRQWKVGDIIRLPKQGGGFRVWRVLGIWLGGESQEDVIELETLDLIVNTQGEMRVPVDMLNVAAASGLN